MTQGSGPEWAQRVLRRIVDLVVAGDWDGLRAEPQVVLRGGGDPLLWVREYPGTLRPLPEDAWEDLVWHPVTGRGWRVAFDLWTVEEGASDLTLEATIRTGPAGGIVELDDIHVL